MTLRRNINTFDYPRHLNPFHEEAEDNNEKFNITDRRFSSCLVNAQDIFSPDEGKSKDSTAACGLVQLMRKLLKKARYHQPSSTEPAKLRDPRETLSPVSSKLSHRSTSSQCTFTRISLRSSLTQSTLHSSNSRPMFPPNDSHSSLSRKMPSLVAYSTENALNNVNTARNQMTAAPVVGKTLFPTSPSEKTVDEHA